MPDADETVTTETDTEQTDQEQDNAADDDRQDEPDDQDDDDENADTFPRAYVEKLRGEAKDNRHRAEAAENRVSEISRQLFRLRVESTGKLADPDDLPYDADLLGDDGKLNAAVDELLAKRPHYARRKVSGNVGAGVTGTREEPFSLLSRLQQSV